MSKKSRGAIRDNLARVLDPPPAPRKRGAHLDGLLNEYAPPETAAPKSEPPASSSSQSASPTESTSHAESASLAPVPDLALRGASLAENTSPARDTGLTEKTLDLWAGMTELHTGYLRL